MMRSDVPVRIVEKRPTRKGPAISEREQQFMLCWVRDMNEPGARWVKITCWIDLRTECCVSNKGVDVLKMSLAALRKCYEDGDGVYKHWQITTHDPTKIASKWKERYEVGSGLLRSHVRYRLGVTF